MLILVLLIINDFVVTEIYLLFPVKYNFTVLLLYVFQYKTVANSVTGVFVINKTEQLEFLILDDILLSLLELQE